MGRWRYHRFFAGCIDMGQFGISWDISEEHNEGKIITAHNADCDAYEARIAELETVLTRETLIGIDARKQLARVKAESLRVVAVPDDYEFMGDYYMTPTGLGWNGSDRHGDGCVETPEGYHSFAECKKVRLERWEDEG